MLTDKKPLNINPPQPPGEPSNEEFVNSYDVAKLLLPFLAKRGIPASPKNYRIFYDYLLHANPVLNKALNELLDNNAKFFGQLSDSLYERFYSNEMPGQLAEAISKGAVDFLALSSALEQSLEIAKHQASHYQRVLSDRFKQMDGADDIEQLQPILDDLLTETDAALASNDNLFSQISETGQAIATLKAEVKNQTAMARIDELTKLYNRWHLTREAPKLMAQSQEINRPLSVVILDLDFFKNLKDTWGRSYVDKALVVCAETIKNTARKTDLAVRLGDEEFLLMCLGLDLAGAGRVVERIRQNLAGADINGGGEKLLTMAISGGAAQHIPGENLSSLLGRADKALYQAKNNGRDTVHMARPN